MHEIPAPSKLGDSPRTTPAVPPWDFDSMHRREASQPASATGGTEEQSLVRPAQREMDRGDVRFLRARFVRSPASLPRPPSALDDAVLETFHRRRCQEIIRPSKHRPSPPPYGATAGFLLEHERLSPHAFARRGVRRASWSGETCLPRGRVCVLVRELSVHAVSRYNLFSCTSPLRHLRMRSLPGTTPRIARAGGGMNGDDG